MGWEGGGGLVVAKLVFVNPQIQIFYVELGFFWKQLFSDEMSSRKKDKNRLHGKNANRCGGGRGKGSYNWAGVNNGDDDQGKKTFNKSFTDNLYVKSI